MGSITYKQALHWWDDPTRIRPTILMDTEKVTTQGGAWICACVCACTHTHVSACLQAFVFSKSHSPSPPFERCLRCSGSHFQVTAGPKGTSWGMNANQARFTSLWPLYVLYLPTALGLTVSSVNVSKTSIDFLEFNGRPKDSTGLFCYF